MESIKYYFNTGNVYNGPTLDDCHVIELSYTGVGELESFVGRFFIRKGYKLETTFGRKATDCTADYSEILHKQFSRNLLTLKYDPDETESILIATVGNFRSQKNFYFWTGCQHKIGNAGAGFITIKHR